MPPELPADARDDFQRDGAVCLRGLFSRDWLDLVARGVERELANPGPFAVDYTEAGQPGRFFGSLVMWQHIPEFEEFIRHSPAAGIMGRIMDSRKIVFYHDQLLVKEPGTGEATPWHHDQPYWFVDGDQVASLWLPLDPVARAGSLELVAGSHRWGHWFAPRYFRDGTDYYDATATSFGPVPDIDADRDGYRILGWAMAPGDCVVFHGLTLHGAPGNVSTTRRRRAWATRWVGDDARFAERPGLVSPAIEGHGLVPGDALDRSPMFPAVWQNDDPPEDR